MYDTVFFGKFIKKGYYVVKKKSLLWTYISTHMYLQGHIIIHLFHPETSMNIPAASLSF